MYQCHGTNTYLQKISSAESPVLFWIPCWTKRFPLFSKFLLWRGIVFRSLKMRFKKSVVHVHGKIPRSAVFLVRMLGRYDGLASRSNKRSVLDTEICRHQLLRRIFSREFQFRASFSNTALRQSVSTKFATDILITSKSIDSILVFASP